MTSVLRTRFLSAWIFFILIASAVFTVPARADSGSPPPAPTTPGGTTHSAAQAPSGATNSAGGGDQGHKVELSSQNAAYIAPAGDPIWCPSGVAVPVPGAGGCSANYANLFSLTNDVETGVIHPVVTNSNIWIQHGVDTSGSQILLDGSVLAALSNVSLNFKGGWNGLGTGTVNQANPSTFTNGLKIANWQNNITLSDVQFNGVTGVLASRGVDIVTKGNITLTRVQANNDWSAGAVLDNTSGNGSVTIANSQFNGDAIVNDIHSLAVYSNNAITLTSVFVNNGWGTLIDNSTGSNKLVTIKSSYFDNNTNTVSNDYGLDVLSTGAITLTNVSATGNYGASTVGGANLDNSSSIFAAPVTLNGTNIFDSNAGFGIEVLSKGTITSASINASSNGSYGAGFDNHTAGTTLPLSLKGKSTFNGNGSDGLDINSNGAITANNLSADGNQGSGAILINDNVPAAASPIKVTGTNEFVGNHANGLRVVSAGAITLNNITANGNGFAGPSFGGLGATNNNALTAQGITVTGTNNFNQNNHFGALLTSKGKVTVSNVNAIGNSTGAGLKIDNSLLGSTMPQSVTLAGHNFLTDNQLDNLVVSTYGTLTINNLTANNSISGNGAGLGLLSAPSKVTLIGLNTFNNNAMIGLDLFSAGPVLTNGLNAINNGSYGAFIDNYTPSNLAPVTIKGINNFDLNGATGLGVTSNGAVFISGVNALSNLGNGVVIHNETSGIFAPVTLKGTNTFKSNSSTGLYIASAGAVVTNGLTAIANTNIGVYIDNSFSGIPAPVTLKGINTFSNNGSGLSITSKGMVVTNNLSAVGNFFEGIYIDNKLSPSFAPVLLNGMNTTSYNSSLGLRVFSMGAITVNSLTASDNGNAGVVLNNGFLGASAGITVKGKNIFWNNIGDGLAIYSKGTVTVTNISSKWNYFNGLVVDTTGTVSVSCGSFISNGTGHVTGYGWETGSSVPHITLIGVTSAGNFTADSHKDNAGTVVTVVPHPCSLP